MKSKVMCMVLFLVVVLVLSPCGKAAIWNPDDPNDLSFNVDFEINANGNPPATPPTTQDAGQYNIVGEANDYNVSDPAFRMWDSNADDLIVGDYCGDFRKHSDVNGGKYGLDCRVLMPHPAGDDVLRIYDLGKTGAELNTFKRTFALWFYFEGAVGYGTFIRHADNDPVNYKNYWWEVRVYDGKLQFTHKMNVLRMETRQTLTQMGILPNTWHHCALVYDRSEREASEIYVDGVQVNRDVTSYDASLSAEVDPYYSGINSSPLVIGSGEAEFEGMLDEVRIYNKRLDPNQVNILYQVDYETHAIALNPFVNATNVAVTTDLLWGPVAGANDQTIYFDNDSDVRTDPLYTDSNNGTVNSKTNAQIGVGNPLTLGTTYYWAVDTNNGLSQYQYPGPVWKFTTEDGNAFDPSPEDGEEDVNVQTINLDWTGCPSAESFDVYFSVDQSLVANKNPTVRIATDVCDSNFAYTTTAYSQIYYWCVDSNMSVASGDAQIRSDVWRFRTDPYPIVFNTDGNEVDFEGVIIPGYNCKIMQEDGSWPEDPNSVGSVASDGTIIFEFDSDFNYNSRYDIIVLPQYNDARDGNSIPTPLAIHVNGNFYFDGRMNISGPNVISADVLPFGRCGGHRGPQKFDGETDVVERGDYRLLYDGYSYFLGKMSPPLSHKGYFYVTLPTADPCGYYRHGLGAGRTGVERIGGGGGYGGLGGNSGRALYQGVTDLGETYGDKEVPVPFGGSAGGFGKVPGGAGGGGVEIAATGNITLDTNSIINADGSDILVLPQNPGGGGSGGSVKIIADGDVTIKGIISVDGGRGGNGDRKANQTGGGGGGGRIAIFHAGSYTNTGSTITANGGEKGYIIGGSPAFNDGESLAENGQNGTIRDFSSSFSPRKASAPIPKDRDMMVYAPVPDTNLILKWYSGYNATPVTEVVYFGTTPTPVVPIGSPVSATRGQHSSTTDVNITAGQTYYWKVVTNGTVSSDVWSFKAVGWWCQEPNDNNVDRFEAGWPEWDTYPHDCVVNMKDLPYFAEYWRENRGGGELSGVPIFDEYTIDLKLLYGFVNEWMGCRGRSNNGCTGWPLLPSP